MEDRSNKTRAAVPAELAVRPWQPVTGLGEWDHAAHQQQQRQREQLGKPLEARNASTHLQQQRSRSSMRPSSAPAGARLLPPGGRDVWPQDMLKKPERFCVACRGGHQVCHEHNPAWQPPYTPLQRYRNLSILESSRFQAAFKRQELPVALTGGNPAICWRLGGTEQGRALRPDSIKEQPFKHLLVLFFEGAREGHEPYRTLASCAALDLLAAAGATQSSSTTTSTSSSSSSSKQRRTWLLEVVPEIAQAIKAGLNTMQPALAGHLMLMLQRLLAAHKDVGPALVPHFQQLIPAMALLQRAANKAGSGHHKRLLLPPQHCEPPVGSFTGVGTAPAGSPTCCQVCGAAFASARQQQQQSGDICGRPASLGPGPALPFGGDQPCLQGRLMKPRRVSMAALVDETLQIMVEAGGGAGLAAVKRCVPTFDYVNPQD